MSLFSQFVLEFYSYSILIFFKGKGFSQPSDEIFKAYKSIPLLDETAESSNKIKILTDIFCVINCISYFVVNFYLFAIFGTINSPFHSKRNALGFVNLEFFCFILFITNFCSVHYMFIFASNQSLFYCALLGVIFVTFLANYIYTFYQYESMSISYKIFLFMNQYVFVSIVVCFVSMIKKFSFSKQQILLVLLIKILFSIFLSQYLTSYKRGIILRIIKNYLFEDYQPSKKKIFFALYRFLIDDLIYAQKNTEQYNRNYIEIFEVILSHKEKCENENCKCKIASTIPKNIFEVYNSSSFNLSSWLVKSVGFIFESVFVNMNPYTNYRYTILLSDYYYHVKENPIFAYAIIDSAISHATVKKIPSTLLVDFYSLRRLYYLNFQEKFQNSRKAARFKNIFEAIHQKTRFNKDLLKYCEIFDSLINSKINFESNLKISYDSDNGEVEKISCEWLNKKNLLSTIINLKIFSDTFKEIKKKLDNESKKTSEKSFSVEFYYTVYLFYRIFLGRIPNNILRLFSNVDVSVEGFTFESSGGYLDQNELGQKLSSYLDTFFSSDYSSNQIILKFSNKGIKIKYISSNLCNILGFVQSNLLGEDFHNIFPKTLREPHSKAMLHNIMFEKNHFYHGSTFIFSQNQNLIPCHVTSATLPQIYGKNLMLVMEIKIVQRDKKILLFDENFNGISLSDQVEEDYLISFKLLQKCETELKDIFDIQQKVVKNYFNDTLEVMTKIKKELKLNLIDKYAKWIFSKNNEFDHVNKKAVIDKDSLSINNINKFLVDTSIVKEKEKKQKFFFSKDYENVLQNIIKAFNKISDNTIKEEQFAKLNKIFPLFNYSISFLDRTKNKLAGKELVKSSTKGSRRKSLFNDLVISNPQRPSLSKINFKVTLRICYNMPLFLVKIRETDDDSSFEAVKEKEREREKMISKKTLFKTSKTLQKVNPQDSSIRSDDKPVPKIKKSNDEIAQQKSNIYSHSSIYMDDSYIQKLFYKRTALNTRTVSILIFITSAILLVLGLLIMITGIKRINDSQTMLNYYFALLFHRDKMYYLESFILTMTFEFGGYSSMNYTDDELFTMMSYQAYVQGDSILQLYNRINQYTQKFKEKESPISLMQNITFYKVIKNWESISFQSDYISEIYYMLYLTKNTVIEKDVENMMKDIDIIFWSKLLLDPSKYINSIYGNSMFFVLTNVNGNFGVVLQNLGETLSSDLNDFIEKGGKVTIIYEFCWMIFSSIYSILFFILVFKFNKKVYQIILSMFIDKENKTILYRGIDSKKENAFVKQKVKNFVNLVQSFNEENRKIFENFRMNFGKQGTPNEGGNYAQSSVRTNTNSNNTNLNSNADTQSQNTLNTNTNSVSSSILNSASGAYTSNSNNALQSHKSNRLLPLTSPKAKGHIGSKFFSNQRVTNANSLFKMLDKKGKLKFFSHLSLFAIVIYTVMFVVFFILMLESALSFQRFLENTRSICEAFTNYLFYVCNFFNIFRVYVIKREKVPDRIIALLGEVSKSEASVEKIATTGYMNKYKRLKGFYNLITIPYDDSLSEDFYGICNYQEKCLNIISEENSYFTQGITLGGQVLFDKYRELSRDFNDFVEKDAEFNKDKLITFLKEKDFSTVQRNVEFVFMNIQTTLYKIFFQDYDTFKLSLRQNTIILYCVGFGIDIIILLLLLFGLLTALRSFLFFAYFSANLFNQAFFSNVHEEIYNNK